MERVETPAARLEGVSSVTVEARGVEPWALLGGGTGELRGFWARGDRWVVHRDAVATVQVRGAGADPERFREVSRRGGALLDSVEVAWREPGVTAPEPRLYGGFAFRPDEDGTEACWSRFPSASFVLPAVEVVGRGERARITVRARRGAEGGAVVEELRRRAAALARRLRSGGSDPLAGDAPEPPTRYRESDRDEWKAAVEEAIRWIERGRVAKVVVARILDVSTGGSVDPAAVVRALWHGNPGTHVFLFEPAPGSALVGAAPETIATLTDGTLRATAVAGSISRGDAPEEQEALALKLLESEKDRVEHAIAVRDMVERLRPLTAELTWDSEPHVLTLSRIQHLETRIKARMEAGETVLSALEALHPTPAVCGLPRDEALSFLRVEEPFDRGWYAGPVGWFDASGDGVFAPALRSAVCTGLEWRLFAGAGIVSGSDPDLEWEETRIKFEPALRALAAAGAGESGAR